MYLRILILMCFLSISFKGHSSDAINVANLYQAWLLAQTQANEERKLGEFKLLIPQTHTLTEKYPNTAESWALSGMIKAHYAHLVSGLEGIRYAKQARDELQKSLSLDPFVFYGSACAELASLYHQTPSWPFSFGSDKMAKRLFNKAKEINPRSLLVNFRYAEFWFEHEKYKKAEALLDEVLRASQIQPQSNPAYKQWSEKKLQVARQMLSKIHHKN